MTTAGILTTDRHFVVQSWDAWIAESTGIEPQAAIGRSLLDLFPDLVERGLSARLMHVVQNEAVEVLSPAFHRYFISCELRSPSANFTRMQQHTTLSPLVENGATTGVVITIEDVTARLDHERDLARILQSSDEVRRLRAAESLAREHAQPATLVSAFHDESWRVRRAAVAGFARRSGEEITEALTRALREQHRDLSVVNSTLSALAISGKDILPRLLEHLRSEDPDLRVYVALALGLIEDDRATPALLEALTDEDANVRFHAIEALGRLRAVDAALPLAGIAATRDFFLGFAALDALGLICDAAVVPVLLPLLEDASLAEPTIDALGRIGGEEVVLPITECLNEGCAPAAACARALSEVCRRAVELRNEGSLIRRLAAGAVDERGAQQLLTALLDVTQVGRDAAALAVVAGWLPGTDFDLALIPLLGSSDVRPQVMEALVARGVAAVPALLEAADHENEEISRAALSLLGRIGSPLAVPRLIEALDESVDTAVIAAHALGGLADDRALEPLLAQLDHHDPTARQAAAAAINSMGSPQLHDHVLRIIRHESVRVRESAARIAGYFGYPDCAADMLAFCHDEDHVLRRAAIEHIGLFEHPAVMETLRSALHDEAPDVRAAAARAIGRLDGAAAAALLREALTGGDPWVRYHAAHAADALVGRQALLPLSTQARSDPHPPARLAAIDALGRIADPVTTRVLVELAEDRDCDVALAALRAVGNSSDPAVRGTVVAALLSGEPERSRVALEAVERQHVAADLTSEIAQLAMRAPDADLAHAAIRLLHPAGLEHLIELARVPSLRAWCVAALTRIGAANASDLAPALADQDPHVRAAAVEALGRCDSPAAARYAAHALDDADERVRAHAVLALQRTDLRSGAA